ncbi:hypothetical protein BaRGS_00015622, partial [Batillaria attramentaria]
MSVTSQQRQVAEELKKRLEKLSRHYDVDTMKVFMVVEALGESSLHAVYSPLRRVKWQSFLQRTEACRLDLARHDKTRESYLHFLTEVGREEQGRQWFQALIQLLHQRGAKPRPSDQRGQDNPTSDNKKTVPLPSQPGDNGGGGGGFCAHLARLFEKKLEAWFDSFQAVAVKLTAHVKVSGLVRVLSGQVHALCTRRGRLHAVLVKVTAQDTPRPLDVAELCLAKVMVIQNGLALPEDLDLALLVLHVNATRPVLRLWVVTPSPEMETAIRMADIDDMIDAGRLKNSSPDIVTRVWEVLLETESMLHAQEVFRVVLAYAKMVGKRIDVVVNSTDTLQHAPPAV